MVTVKIKDGTPQGSASLCVTCRYVHIVRGFSASEQQARCQGVWPSQLMHFPLSQCSSYDDSRLPGKRDMEKIAWIWPTKKAGRSIDVLAVLGGPPELNAPARRFGFGTKLALQNKDENF